MREWEWECETSSTFSSRGFELDFSEGVTTSHYELTMVVMMMQLASGFDGLVCNSRNSWMREKESVCRVMNRFVEMNGRRQHFG